MRPVFFLPLISGCVNAAGLFCCGANTNAVSNPSILPPIESQYAETSPSEPSVTNVTTPATPNEPETPPSANNEAEEKIDEGVQIPDVVAIKKRAESQVSLDSFWDFPAVSSTSSDAWEDERVIEFDDEGNFMAKDGRSDSVRHWQDLAGKVTAAVIASAPFNYEVEVPHFSSLHSSTLNRVRKFNRYFLAFPIHSLEAFQELYLQFFMKLYPGLQHVPIEQKDVAGLLVFGLLHLANNESRLDKHSFLNAIFAIHERFCNNSEIIHRFLQVYRYSKSINIDEAFDLLLRLAMQSRAYYTVEAFLATNRLALDKNALFLSIEGFAYSRDWRIFNRIRFHLGTVDLKEIIIHAAKHKAADIFLTLLETVDANLIDEIKSELNTESLLCYVIEKGGISPLLLESYPWTEGEVDASLFSCLKSRNYLMFNHLINQNKYPIISLRRSLVFISKKIFAPEADPVSVIETLRQELVRPTNGQISISGLVQLLLQLNSPLPTPVAVFSWLLKNKEINFDNKSQFLDGNPVVDALFLENQEYLTAILDRENKLTPSLVQNNVPIWEWIKGAKNYSQIMHIIIGAKNFDILKAIANPNLDLSHWERLLPLDFAVTLTYRYSLAGLVDLHFFDEDIITVADRTVLKIGGALNWTLLHLAVVSFNVRAVVALLSRGADREAALSDRDIRTPVMLARSILSHLSSSKYLENHPMEHLNRKVNLRNQKRDEHPDFCNEPKDTASAISIRERAITNCKKIIELIEEDRTLNVKSIFEFFAGDFDL